MKMHSYLWLGIDRNYIVAVVIGVYFSILYFFCILSMSNSQFNHFLAIKLTVVRSVVTKLFKALMGKESKHCRSNKVEFKQEIENFSLSS